MNHDRESSECSTQPKNDYPTSDGKPMAETDLHRDLMIALIETLKWWFADDPDVYVSGNLLDPLQKGNKRSSRLRRTCSSSAAFQRTGARITCSGRNGRWTW